MVCEVADSFCGFMEGAGVMVAGFFESAGGSAASLLFLIFIAAFVVLVFIAIRKAFEE